MMEINIKIKSNWQLIIQLLFIALFLFPVNDVNAEFKPSGKLEIHYINVGQGGCTLIIGPDGTRILYDFGGREGNRDIVPYLMDSIDLSPEDGLHYTIVSHRDTDHYVGYRDVVDAGYDVLLANYGSGSSKAPTKKMRSTWLGPAKRTTAGAVKPIKVGYHISLGHGADAIVIAANGRVYGRTSRFKVPNENDRSVALFIRYGKFKYLLDGDLGSGPERCTNHQTSQRDIQTPVARALISSGLMNTVYGVDVLHIAHHGSESSTSSEYYNIMRPEVGLISVGLNQRNFLHPREDVVDRVLIGDTRADCVEAPPLKALFQTEDGKKDCSSTGCTSFSGLSIGDIKLVTDGKTGYTITGSNRVHGGKAEAEASNNTWPFSFDERGE
jgi:beta-lactamase superfamily II metal-dependent hydrolase